MESGPLNKNIEKLNLCGTMFRSAPPSNKRRTCGAKIRISAAALIRVNTVTDRIEMKVARKRIFLMSYVVFTPITKNTKSHGGTLGFSVLAIF